MENKPRRLCHSRTPAHWLVPKCTRTCPPHQVEIPRSMITEATSQGQASHTQDHTLRAQRVLHEWANPTSPSHPTGGQAGAQRGTEPCEEHTACSESELEQNLTPIDSGPLLLTHMLTP